MMENNETKMAQLVGGTMKQPDLAKKKPWSSYLNWTDQLCAIVNIVSVLGGAIATEIKTLTESFANYREAEFLVPQHLRTHINDRMLQTKEATHVSTKTSFAQRICLFHKFAK